MGSAVRATTLLLAIILVFVFIVPVLRDAYLYYLGSLFRVPYLLSLLSIAIFAMLIYIIRLVVNLSLLDTVLLVLLLLPFTAYGLLIFAAAAVVVLLFAATDTDAGTGTVSKAALALLGVFIVVYFFYYIAMPLLAASLVTVYNLTKPPTIYGNVRIVPLAVAAMQVKDHIQNPAYHIIVGDAAVYYDDSNAYYGWIIEPSGLWNQLTKHPLGIAVVNASVYPLHYRFYKIRLEMGIHTLNGFEPSWLRVAAAGGYVYDADMADPIVTPRVVAVPLIGYKRSLLARAPYVAGYVSLIDGRRLSLATVHKLAPGAPLVPAAVAREWAEAATYRVGVINVIVGNRIVIRDIGNNSQPYLLPVKVNGTVRPMWVFVADSVRTHAAVAILLVDPYNTKPHVYIYMLKTPVMSFSNAHDYIIQSHPSYDWRVLSLQDPHPIFINDTLWWMVAVTGKQLRSLVSLDVVSAVNGVVRYIDVSKAGVVTPEDVLRLLTVRAATPQQRGGKHYTVQEIIAKINRIERELEELKEMLKELNETRR